MSDIYSKLHNLQETEFSRLYFSNDNVTLLQNSLQMLLLQKGYKNKIQCYDTVLSYMMNIYELYANPLNQDYRNETLKLNQLVLDKMFSILSVCFITC